MLSAVENFGPATGPSVAFPYAHHHPTYAVAAASAASVNFVTQPSPFTPTTPSHLHAFEGQRLEPFQHRSDTSHKLQYEPHHHLGLFLQPSLLSPLPSSLSSAATSCANISSPSKRSTIRHVDPDHLRHMIPEENPYSSRSTTASLDNSTAQNLSKADNRPIMSINEFTRPHPKHHRHSAIQVHQSNMSPTINEDLNRSNYCNESGPINLATTNPFFSNSHSQLTSKHFNDSRPSSTSSSVDIENDDSMSPSGTPLQNRKSIESTTLAHKVSYDTAPPEQKSAGAIAAAAAAAAAYQFSNYTHLYTNRPTLYGAPLVFSPHHPVIAPHSSALRTHASYLNDLPTHLSTQSNDPNAYSNAYLKAIQNSAVAAGNFGPAGTASMPPRSSPSNSGIPTRNSRACNSSDTMLALTHSTSSMLPKTAAISNDLRHKSQIESKAEPTSAPKPATGTFLNEKVNPPAVSTDVNNFFKVPSGKDASFKNRIATRPSYLEKPESCRTSVMRTYDSTSNFKKGSYIQLGNGILRRVEDMRTEDFIQCAERSPHHQLTELTVVRINATQHHVLLITFNYDKNRAKADMEVSAEHPFFVYGQGWASCSPEASLKAFGLKCKRLQVGDICISLTQRDISSTSSNKNMYVPDAESSSRATASVTSAPYAYSPKRNDAPTQSLSVESHTERREHTEQHVPISMAALTEGSPFFPAVHNMPIHLLSPHLAPHHAYADNMRYTTSAPLKPGNMSLSDAVVANAALHHLTPKLIDSFYQQQSQQLYHSTAQHNELKATSLTLPRPSSIHEVPPQYYESSPMLPVAGSSYGQNQNGVNGMDVHCNAVEQDQPVDVSMSRKRRWSAPESICDKEAESKQMNRYVAPPQLS